MNASGRMHGLGLPRAECKLRCGVAGASVIAEVGFGLPLALASQEPERVKALARSIAEGVTALPNIETAATGTISAEVGGPEVVDIPEEDASGVKDVAAPTKSLSVLAVVLLGGALRMEIRA